MEENIVNMGPAKDKEEKKLSYEELSNAAQNLSAQYQNLLNKYKELAEAHQELLNNNFFIRLDWLWRVINSEGKFPQEFVTQCVNEFMANMQMPKQEDTDNKD